jgi:hypothetical protein
MIVRVLQGGDWNGRASEKASVARILTFPAIRST